MKILIYTTAYPGFVQRVYNKHQGLEQKTFATQRAEFFYESFAWSDAYSNAFAKIGLESTEIYMNVEPMQRAWARENLSSSKKELSLESIALEQIKRFQPDVLFFDNHDAEILKTIKAAVPSIRFVLAWVGSAIHSFKTLAATDLVLSCAPESVEKLTQQGIQAKHLNHAFDGRILERIKPLPKTKELIFIGQILHGREYHAKREALLLDLTKKTPLQIYSPSAEVTGLQRAKTFLKFVRSKITNSDSQILQKIHPELKKNLFPSVYGLDMYQLLHESRVTLNIHADSSPTHASNARLFESTGVATCLLTDWRGNLASMFAEDKEIVTYRNADECVEKARWLLNNPKECEAIAKAGQARTLREHTFEARARDLEEIIKANI